MAMERIEIPPTPMKLIGEIDLDMFYEGTESIVIVGPAGKRWIAHAIAAGSGSLIFVPGIRPRSL